jgi:uncharacterized protein (TIGR02246 family)
MLSELHNLNERWYQAWLEKDAATVERLMAEDYLYVAPSGLVLDRQAILAIIRSPSYRLDYCTRTAVVVRAVGQEAAIVRHHVQAAGSFEGASFMDDHRCVIVWEKHAGGWRIVIEQCSFYGK